MELSWYVSAKYFDFKGKMLNNGDTVKILDDALLADHCPNLPFCQQNVLFNW